MASSILITPYMMIPGNEQMAADRLYAVLSHPPKIETKKRSDQPPATLAGQWELELTFTRGAAEHTLVFEQQNNTADRHAPRRSPDRRSHRARRWQRRALPQFAARAGHAAVLRLQRHGRPATPWKAWCMLAEYGQASWTAQRHQYGSPDSGVVRPVKSRYGRTN